MNVIYIHLNLQFFRILKMYLYFQNAIAMVSKLTYDPKFEKAMRYIFGKTLICRNLEVATDMSKQYNLDCITIDGDQVCRITINIFPKINMFNSSNFYKYL